MHISIIDNRKLYVSEHPYRNYMQVKAVIIVMTGSPG